MTTLHSEFQSTPVVREAPPPFVVLARDYVPYQPDPEIILPALERATRAEHWRRSHPMTFAVRCADAWPPIHLCVSREDWPALGTR